MKFGPVPLLEAEGALLAHALKTPSGKLRKGHALTVNDIVLLQAQGLSEVIVARPDPDDVLEDSAAFRVARALQAGSTGLRLTQPFTGRVNILANLQGVARIDAEKITAANLVEPMITIATVPPNRQVHAGGMVATVKIISYAVPGAAVSRAADAASGALDLARPVFDTASLIFTEIPGLPGADKGQEAIEARLTGLGMSLHEVLRVPHDSAALARALTEAKGEIVLILTASATSDPRDVAPEALRAAGGSLTRFGLPVDPGNLLFFGQLGDRPVIGLPGSARSPVLHGADWVLARIACGLPVPDAEIAAMGVGGLLKEIPTRPQPRQRPRDRSS